MPEIVCIIPVYNEERHVAAVINAIPASVHHIVVVDDASTDDTARIVRRIDDPRITLVQLRTNMGVGGAMITGYRKAMELGADIMVKLDGDGQMDPANIPALVAPIAEGRADYAKGVRFHHRRELKQMPWERLWGNIGLSFLVKAASGYWNILDPTNGFTAIGRTALDLLPLASLSHGFFFESDMLIALARIQAVVVDISIPARYGNERSHLSPVRSLLSFPSHLLRRFCSRILWRYFLLDFNVCSVFMVTGTALLTFATLFGGYHWIKNFVNQVPTATGTIMIAALTFILGFQLLLQAIVLDIQNVPRTPLQKTTWN